jgi:hypothetical protein
MESSAAFESMSKVVTTSENGSALNMDKEESYSKGVDDRDIDQLLITDPIDDQTEGEESEKEVTNTKSVKFAIELNPMKQNKADQSLYNMRNYRKGEKHNRHEN